MPADAVTINLPELLASIKDPIVREATPVAQLSGGPVSCAWQLDSAIGPVVLRYDLPFAAKLQMDRKTELVVLRDAAQAGVGPDLLWADIRRGLLATRMLPGRIWHADDIIQPNNLIRLGRLLSDLHSRPFTFQARDLRLTLAIYAQLANTAKARSVNENAQKLLAELSMDSGNHVFCHGDVHSGNIVDDGELRLIDWEYGRAADPCLELAIVARQHRLQSDQLNCLLEGYAGSAITIDRVRLRQFCRFYDCLAALWYSLAGSEPLHTGWSLKVPRQYLD
jgi:thiamine kinase-like enzyme